ncbi:MAG: DUF6134 family protein [Gammaproteobacteria bacterium]
MSIRIITTSVLWLLIAAAMQTASALDSNSREWRFRVLLDDAEIGYHTFRLSEDDGQQIVDSEASFRVRVLFIPAYRYDHVNQELWRKDCLVGINAETRVNGDSQTVTGLYREDGFVLREQAGDRELDSCVMSFAYWNPAFLGQSRLLNSQTGDYMTVDIQSVGEELINIRGSDIMATRYSLSADSLNMDLWYSVDREWLGLESVTSSGRKLRYQLL